jgi:hypothetical protein
MFVVEDKVILRLRFKGHFTGKFHNKIGQGQAINFSAVDMYTIKNGESASACFANFSSPVFQKAAYRLAANIILSTCLVVIL